MAIPVEYARLAYDGALRALDRQEALLEEMRGRTGTLLTASSLAASFLGARALEGNPTTSLVIVALVAFVASIAGSVFILVPRGDKFVFSVSGPGLFEGLYEHRGDLPEVYRRLTYDLARFWEENDRSLKGLFRAFRLAAAGLVIEILALTALVSDTIFGS